MSRPQASDENGSPPVGYGRGALESQIAVDAAETNKRQPTSFLSLPREIRNIVYIHAVERERPIRVHKTDYRMYNITQQQWNTSRGENLCGSLLRTCRAVHAEASAMLYSNGFVLDSLEDMAAWLRKIGPRNRAHLWKLYLVHRFEIVSYSAPEPPHSVAYQRSNVAAPAYQTSREVAGMLADSARFESLNLGMYYDARRRRVTTTFPRRDNRPRWFTVVRVLAEIVHRDFWPFLEMAISRAGGRLDQACSLVKVSWDYYREHEDFRREFSLREDFPRACDEVLVEHLMLLLSFGL